MTIFPIVITPDARLKKQSEKIVVVDDSIRQIMDDMLETMYATNGIGLAAIQVGIAKRIVVIDLDYGSKRYENTDNDEKKKPNPIFIINPKITKTSEEKNTYEEGCLSFPGQYADVTRPKKVTVEYLDYNGNSQIMEADDLLATCIQHEIDHLNGITFVDYLSRIKRSMIIKKIIKNANKDEK